MENNKTENKEFVSVKWSGNEQTCPSWDAAWRVYWALRRQGVLLVTMSPVVH